MWDRFILSFRLFVFGPDKKQGVRIRRLLLASSTYVVGMFIINFCRVNGLFPSSIYWLVLGGALLVNLVFYVIIRWDLNQWARDPSLTFPQMLVASMVNTYLVANTDEARGALLIGYVLILVFGIFKLRRREFLRIGAIVITTYGALISFEFLSHKPGFRLSLELLQWLMLVFVYPWFAWVGGYIGDLRRQQRETNQRLEQALHQNLLSMKLIQQQAICDELTGLYNRRYILDQLATEKARADQGGCPFSVLIIDVDHFKRINDTVGHFVGDKVLKESVAAIRGVLRESDTLSRWGGEEFMALMPSAGLDALHDVMQRIHRCVEEIDFSQCGLDSRVTVSIGAAQWRPGETLEEMLTAADNALYRAKQNGRNRSEFRLAAA
jgi:diguanylate cyclase